MSNRQRGGKTLSAEDEITADSVNLVGEGLFFNGNKGSAHQVLQVDTNGEQNFKAITIPPLSIDTAEIKDDAVTGAKLADDISISTTGIAGPGGKSQNKPIGLVYICIKFKNKFLIYKKKFKGTRIEIQKKTVNFVFKEIYKLI